MASQQGPPIRPWFRLASMVPPRPPPPAAPTQQPDLVPPPRPAFIRPAFRVPTAAPPQEPTPPPPVAPPPAVTAPPTPIAVVPPPAPPIAPPPATPSPPTVVTPTPQTVAAPPPSSPAAPQFPPTIISSVPTSSITTTPAPAPSSPKPKVSTPSTPLRKSPAFTPMSPSLPAPAPSPTREPSPTATTGPPTITTHAATPMSSPKIVKPLEKTPPPSPNIKPISYPPSPLTLPPSQLKSDTEHETKNMTEFKQKTVLVQDTKEKPKVLPKNFNVDQTHSPKREIIKENRTHKKSSDSEDFGMRIITIAGENKGAIMELSPSHKKHEFGNNPHSLHIKKGNPIAGSDDKKSGSDSCNITENGRSKMKDKNQKAVPRPMTAFMNSNVQAVNNSILYNCSTTHRDPGVHFSVSRKPNGSHGIHLKDHKDG